MEKKRILIVDDEESLAKVYKLLIENTGKYDVWKETSGENAFFTAKQFKPDLILLDILMPDIDGGAVAEQLKEDEETKDIPIVFISAAITKEEEENKQGLIKGGYPILAKPVPMEKLLDTIEKYTSDTKDNPPVFKKERRKHKRVKTLNLLSYECVDENDIPIERGMGKILDISQGGLQLETSNLVNSKKIILSTNDINGNVIEVSGNIIYSKKTDQETFHTGIEFNMTDDKNARRFVVELIKVFNAQKNRQ